MQNLQILCIFVLPAEICNTFTPKAVQISAHNTKLYKNWQILQGIFSAFYTILKPNFVVLQMLMLFLPVVTGFGIYVKTKIKPNTGIACGISNINS